MNFVFVEERPIAGVQRPIAPGTSVGRAGADVDLVDPDVSRTHATFHVVDSGVGVEDLGSRNGTYVNDERISGITALSEGDRVRFGNTVWRLDAIRETAEPESAETAP